MADSAQAAKHPTSAITALTGGSFTGAGAAAIILWQSVIGPQSDRLTELEKLVSKHQVILQTTAESKDKQIEGLNSRLDRIENQLDRLTDAVLSGRATYDMRG